MNKLRALLLIMGSILIASLLIACDSSAEITAPTAVPTAVPEPPTAIPESTENLGPADKSEVPRVTAKELKDRLDSGAEILLIDTRGQTGYDYEHIPGAIREQDNYDDVPHDQEIVFYCDCPAENESAISALKLYEKGFTNVSALMGGIDAWQEAQYPTEKS